MRAILYNTNVINQNSKFTAFLNEFVKGKALTKSLKISRGQSSGNYNKRIATCYFQKTWTLYGNDTPFTYIFPWWLLRELLRRRLG